uniref:Uncharacterized protein n=1 Tax=Tanacetum cinerariifolium TaxID=118510 RepID=A0A699JID8_TANCI|nr:hypothetical protein [Tanacetum cinerariifolium]
MSQDVLLTGMNSMSLIDEYVNVERKRSESCDMCFNLEAELLKSQNAHNDLLKRIFKKNDLNAQLQDKDTTIASKELPKVSLVNESLKKLKLHLANFDKVVKIRTTPNAQTEGELGFEHTKAVFNSEITTFLKSLKDIFNMFDRDLLDEIMEVKTVFDQIDFAVRQSSVDK